MHLGGRERADDGAALEELFASVSVNPDWTVGFLTALCSGPDPVAAEIWVAEIVPDGSLDDDPAARVKLDTLARLYVSIGDALRTTPEMICPEPDKPEQEATDFCLGYLKGARLHERWRSDEAERAALTPFEILAKEKDADDARRVTEREELGRNVAAIYARWQAKRQVVHTTPKVGRNDPCPCGSGKKHKKCCAR